MKKSLLDRFRRALAMRRSSLQTWLSGAARPVPVPPDGSAPGEETADDLSVLVELERALEEIDHGTFGHCVMCAGEVEPERLALDFTTCVCLDHYSEAQKRDLERDLEMAASVQQHLFPCCVPSLSGIELAAHAQPARIVSGDYYDFFSCPDAAQGVIIADVMGKGVAASMLMANLQASLRILGPEYDTLHDLAGRLNELFQYNLKQIRFLQRHHAGGAADVLTGLRSALTRFTGGKLQDDVTLAVIKVT